jgi:hypothetical protein
LGRWLQFHQETPMDMLLCATPLAGRAKLLPSPEFRRPGRGLACSGLPPQRSDRCSLLVEAAGAG